MFSKHFSAGHVTFSQSDSNYVFEGERERERAMAVSSRFASPVNDATEEQLRLTRIPEKTKSATAWGIRVWNDWATARASTVETAGHA